MAPQINLQFPLWNYPKRGTGTIIPICEQLSVSFAFDLIFSVFVFFARYAQYIFDTDLFICFL